MNLPVNRAYKRNFKKVISHLKKEFSPRMIYNNWGFYDPTPKSNIEKLRCVLSASIYLLNCNLFVETRKQKCSGEYLLKVKYYENFCVIYETQLDREKRGMVSLNDDVLSVVRAFL